MLGLTQTWTIWSNGNTSKFRVEEGWGHEQNTCNISETVQNRTKDTVTDYEVAYALSNDASSLKLVIVLRGWQWIIRSWLAFWWWNVILMLFTSERRRIPNI